MTKQFVVLALLTGTLAVLPSMAKLPPPSDEAKAKAAETAAKAAWTDKVGAFQLCRATDKLAARYLAEAGKVGKPATPTPTPTPTPPCTDPGPFVFEPPVAVAANAPATTPTPPASKPLESAGAHSPPGNAVSPPSTKTPAAATAPAPVAALKK